MERGAEEVGDGWVVPEEIESEQALNDAISNVLLEVGLEGWRGIAPPRLLQRLHAVSPALRRQDEQEIWTFLLRHVPSGTLSMHLLPESENPTTSFRQDGSRRPSCWPPAFGRAVSPEEVLSLQHALALHTHSALLLVPHPSLREHCLGTFLFSECSTSTSNLLHLVLDEISISREEGIWAKTLQAELSQSGRDFGYISDNLICRRLVVRHKTRDTTGRAGGHLLVYRLSRFANSPVQHPVLFDDSEYSATIVSLLEQLPNRCGTEALIKHHLNIGRSKSEHRKWQNIRRHQEDHGYISCFVPDDGFRKKSYENNTYLQLRDGISSDLFRHPWPSVSPRGPTPEQLQSHVRPTLTLCQQVYNELWSAGQAGMRTTDLYRRLLLNARIGKTTLDAFAAQNDVKLQKEKIGKLNALRAFARNAPVEPTTTMSSMPIASRSEPRLQTGEEQRKYLLMDVVKEHGFVSKPASAGALNHHPKRPMVFAHVDRRMAFRTLETLSEEGSVCRTSIPMHYGNRRRGVNVEFFIRPDLFPPTDDFAQTIKKSYADSVRQGYKGQSSGSHEGEEQEPTLGRLKGLGQIVHTMGKKRVRAHKLTRRERRKLSRATGYVMPRCQRLKVLHIDLFNISQQNDLRLESIKEKLKMETYLKLFGFLDRGEAKASETHKLSQLQWELLTLVEQQEGIAVEELPSHLYAFMWCGDELSELDKLLATLRSMELISSGVNEPLHFTLAKKATVDTESGEKQFSMDTKNELVNMWETLESIYSYRQRRDALIEHVKKPRPLAFATEVRDDGCKVDTITPVYDEEPLFNPREWTPSRNVRLAQQLRIMRCVANMRHFNDIEIACCLNGNAGPNYEKLSIEEVKHISDYLECDPVDVLVVTNSSIATENTVQWHVKRKRTGNARQRNDEKKKKLSVHLQPIKRRKEFEADEGVTEDDDEDYEDGESDGGELMVTTMPADGVKRRHGTSAERRAEVQSSQSSSDSSQWKPEDNAENKHDHDHEDDVVLMEHDASEQIVQEMESEDGDDVLERTGDFEHNQRERGIEPVHDSSAPAEAEHGSLRSNRAAWTRSAQAHSSREREIRQSEDLAQISVSVPPQVPRNSKAGYAQPTAFNEEDSGRISTSSVRIDMAAEILKMALLCCSTSSSVPTGLWNTLNCFGTEAFLAAVERLRQSMILQVDPATSANRGAYRLHETIATQLSSFPRDINDEFSTTIEELELHRDVVAHALGEPSDGRIAALASAYADGQLALSFRGDPSDKSYANIEAKPSNQFSWNSHALPQPQQIDDNLCLHNVSEEVALASTLFTGPQEMFRLALVLMNLVARECADQGDPTTEKIASAVRERKVCNREHSNEQACTRDPIPRPDDVELLLRSLAAAGAIERVNNTGQVCWRSLICEEESQERALREKLKACVPKQMRAVARRLSTVRMLKRPDTALNAVCGDNATIHEHFSQLELSSALDASGMRRTGCAGALEALL